MEDFITQLFIFPLFMVFLRLGGAIMVFPVLADGSVNVRVRLLLALTASFAMYPALMDKIPPLPNATGVLVGMIFSELLIGILMAIGARLFMSAMTVAGDVLSYMAGLQAATLFDPQSNSQTTAPALLLSMVGLMIVLLLNLHLQMIQAIHDSYTILPVGQLPHMADTAQAIIKVVADMFLLGVKLATPVIAVGFLTYMAFGLLNRLVPQVQAFFISMPVTIAFGLFVLGLAMSSMITLFGDELTSHAILFNQSTEQQ